jgi:hypothetical protein
MNIYYSTLMAQDQFYEAVKSHSGHEYLKTHASKFSLKIEWYAKYALVFEDRGQNLTLNH